MSIGTGVIQPLKVNAATRRRVGEYAVAILEGLVATAAYGGGVAMIADPAGGLIRLPPEMLDRIPVDSWLLPGVALFVSNGVVPTVVAAATLRGRQWRPGSVMSSSAPCC